MSPQNLPVDSAARQVFFSTRKDFFFLIIVDLWENDGYNFAWPPPLPLANSSMEMTASHHKAHHFMLDGGKGDKNGVTVPEVKGVIFSAELRWVCITGSFDNQYRAVLFLNRHKLFSVFKW